MVQLLMGVIAKVFKPSLGWGEVNVTYIDYSFFFNSILFMRIINYLNKFYIIKEFVDLL
jgi:hypothetical protein